MQVITVKSGREANQIIEIIEHAFKDLVNQRHVEISTNVTDEKKKLHAWFTKKELEGVTLDYHKVLEFKLFHMLHQPHFVPNSLNEKEKARLEVVFDELIVERFNELMHTNIVWRGDEGICDTKDLIDFIDTYI